MEEANARLMLPVYADTEYQDERRPRMPRRMYMENEFHRLKKRYGIALVALFAWAASMMLGCCITGTVVRNNDMQYMEEEYARRLAAYQEEQALQKSAEYFLSGDASREAAINQEIDAVAQVISKLSTDAQKATEAACMLARVMSPAYPNSFAEVASQPQQWMFYDGTDTTFSQHDRDIAESIVRPYMESGIVPNGLTSKMVYGTWTETDFVLRDTWEASQSAHYWRYA